MSKQHRWLLGLGLVLALGAATVWRCAAASIPSRIIPTWPTV
jgi:hypothetical protein